MTNYAIIEDNKVLNVIVAESAELAAELTGKEILETTGEPWIDWTRTDGVWSAPVEPEPEVTE
jgi:hypothetical protein